MKHLGIFTRYDRMGASSRLRFYQWEEDFAVFGFEPDFYPLFNQKYLKKLYSTGKKSKIALLIASVRRFFQVLKSPKDLYIEYELFPFLPAKWELLLLRRKRYFLGFDDNVWEKYQNCPSLSDKYNELIRHAAGVIVANDFLCEKVKPLSYDEVNINIGCPASTVVRKGRGSGFLRTPDDMDELKYLLSEI